jgi:iron complex transport system permease protein
MRRQTIFITLCIIALPASLVASLMIGEIPIAPGMILAVLGNHLHITHIEPIQPVYADAIVFLRLPRVLAGALVGAALATAGALFQGLLRNPLADPYLLGISSGAALGTTCAFLLPSLTFLGIYAVPPFAFAGALLAISLVYWLARAGQRTPAVTLILAGVAVSALLSAMQVVLITQNLQLATRLGSLYTWLSGDLVVGNDPLVLPVIAAIIATGIASALTLAPTLDAFALGEEGAAHLGIHVERAKSLIVGVAALLVAAAVGISGIVGFVGLFVPHICRLVVGPRHRILLPTVAIAGSLFLTWADVLARTILPVAFHSSGELPLGVITALVGGPFFLWLLRQSGKVYAEA